MEDLLLQRHEQNKKSQKYSTVLSVLSNEDVYSSFAELAEVLRNFRSLKKTASSEEGKSSSPPSASVGGPQKSNIIISASWLLDQCSRLPSSNMMGGPLPMALSIHEICTRYQHQEADLQAALFELIGTDHMDFLLDLVPNASKVATVIRSKDLEIQSDRAATSTERKKEKDAWQLREDALEAMTIAAITKAQADSILSQGPSVSGKTHSVSRASDKYILKEAKRAAKRAAAAINQASEAGVFGFEDHLPSSLDRFTLQDEAQNFGAKKGVAGMSDEDLRAMRANLLPEGSKVYYDTLGLPAGTKREWGDGYEKVTISPRIMDESTRRERIKISEVMSATERRAFEGTEYLNPMQSTVFEAAFLSQENLLICAPTGAGKTNVAMLCIVAHLRDKGVLDGKIMNSSLVSGFAPRKKVIYIAPMKALAQEVVEKFDSKLKSLKIVSFTVNTYY